MTTSLRAKFDGKVLVPEEPVDLPQGKSLDLTVSATSEAMPIGADGLSALAEWAETLPVDPDSPGDRAIQHDHYLYGTPKRP